MASSRHPPAHPGGSSGGETGQGNGQQGPDRDRAQDSDQAEIRPEAAARKAVVPSALHLPLRPPGVPSSTGPTQGTSGQGDDRAASDPQAAADHEVGEVPPARASRPPDRAPPELAAEADIDQKWTPAEPMQRRAAGKPVEDDASEASPEILSERDIAILDDPLAGEIYDPPAYDPGMHGGGHGAPELAGATDEPPSAAVSPVASRTASLPNLQSLTAAWLVVESGNDRGRRYSVRGSRTSVGRAVENDVVLTDLSVSRKHLVIEFDGQTYVTTDVGSGNGTLINEREADGPYQLHHGDKLELGNTVMVFECTEVDLQPESLPHALLPSFLREPGRPGAPPHSPLARPIGGPGPDLISPPGASGRATLSVGGRATLTIDRSLRARVPAPPPGSPHPERAAPPDSPASARSGRATLAPGAAAAASMASSEAARASRTTMTLQASDLARSPARSAGRASASPSAPDGFTLSSNAGAPVRFQYPNGVMMPLPSSGHRRLLVGILGIAFVAVGAGIVLALLRGDVDEVAAHKEPGPPAAQAERTVVSTPLPARVSGPAPAYVASQPPAPARDQVYGVRELQPSDFGTDEKSAPATGGGADSGSSSTPDVPAAAAVVDAPNTNDVTALPSPARDGLRGRPERRPVRRRPRLARATQDVAHVAAQRESEKATREVGAGGGSVVPAALRRAEFFYRQKKFAAAAAYLRGVARSANRDDRWELRTRAASYGKIGALLDQGQRSMVSDAPGALVAFTSALSLDEKFGESLHDRTIGARIAQVAPIAAGTYMARKEYPEAKAAADMAEKFGSGDSDRVRIVRVSLERKASQLFDEAKNLADAGQTDRAAEIARLIIRMVPRSSDIYPRAAKLASQ